MTFARALLFLVATANGACDPVQIVRGEVRSVPDMGHASGDVYAAGKPIAGAIATLVCRERVKLGTTDATGRFESKGVGWLDAKCAVEVSADGYYPESVRIGDVCVGREGDSCHALRVNVELVPKPGMTASGAEPNGPAPGQRVVVRSDPADLRVYLRREGAFGFAGYDLLGTSPGVLTLPPGTLRLAAAPPGRAPAEASEDLLVPSVARLQISYTDRSSTRTWGWVALVTGIVGGAALCAASAVTRGAARTVLLGSCVTVGAGGIVYAMDATQQADVVRVAPAP